MSRQLAWALVADGGTDRMLVPIIQWAIHRLDPEVEILEPEFRKRTGSVGRFLESFASGASLIFVHRDAETASLEQRLSEFNAVVRKDVVPVVPVRMSEAWLLIDGPAIARAAGSPDHAVLVPRLSNVESISNAKNTLDKLLIEAAGSPSGRRAKQFKRDLVSRRVNITRQIDDYSLLEQLPSFRRFQATLAERYPF